MTPVSTFVSLGTYGSSTAKPFLSIACGSNVRIRYVSYKSDTSINFSASYNVTASGSDTSSNIPLEVIGIKVEA